VAGHVFLPIAELVAWPWNLSGLLFIASGIWLNLDADRAFKARRTTVKPFQESSVLITDGSYNISRHPMYLGMLLILCGLATLLGSVFPFLVVPILWILLDRRFVKIEEKMLEYRFGEDWQRFTGRVRRWI
jgi:protein-S-isoprenylcysteine O-methyltransferase Ste14